MNIPTPLAVFIIGGFVLIAGGVGYYRLQEAENGDFAVDPEANDSRPFRTEEEWTVLQITQFLGDLGGFAGGNQASTAPVVVRHDFAAKIPGTYEVKRKNKNLRLSVEKGVWEPASYLSWAQEMFGSPDGMEPDRSSLEGAQALLDPRWETFAAENARISEFLTAHPSSAQGHLQAALLVGTVALNDYAGTFRDTRFPLHRMTAHLAAADALGLAATDSGRQLAEAIRLTLCGQQTDALKLLDGWETAGHSTWEEWKALLRLRNTLDWRGGREAALTGSRGLQQEYFRTLVRAVNASAAGSFLQEARLEPDLEFCRIANESRLSVQNGHRFTLPLFPADWKQAAKVSGADQSGDDTVFKAYLDTPEGSPVTEGKIEVAGKNLFGSLLQRQLMQSSDRLFRFLNDAWGVPEQAAQLRQFLHEKMPDLRYKPFLIRMIARSDKARADAQPACEEVIKNQIEIVTPTLWQSLWLNERGVRVGSAPDFHSWFHPEVPRGTAFHTGDRLFEIGVGDENNEPWLKTLWERAPYVLSLALHNAYLENGRTYNNLSAPIFTKWAGVMTEYNLNAMRELADCYRGQPDLFEATMLKAAALDPNSYEELGEYFEKRQMPERAASAYLQGFAHATDRVWVANNAEWLVRYLFEKGDIAKAEEVAADAADVYSFDGLEAQQWLQEKQGKWESALETARKIDQRYFEGDLIVERATLIRLAAADQKLANDAGYEAKVLSLFPEGPKKTALADFTAPPTQGVRIEGSSKAMVPFGLERGMVIVAVDGFRTENLTQYDVIRSVSDSPLMSLIVWDGKSYRLSEGSLPNRRFGVDMADYSNP